MPPVDETLQAAAGADTLRVELDAASGVATVTLCRPKVNALSVKTLGALRRLFSAIGGDGRVRGVLLRSDQPKAFSAGLDLSDARGFRSRQDVAAYVRLLSAGLGAPAVCPKPVACAVEGHALAGGMILAAACDFVALGTRRRFKCGVTEVNVGMVFPRAGLELVRAHVGGSTRGFRRFVQDGVTVDREEAFAMGFGDALVEDPEAAAAAWLKHKLGLRAGIFAITKRHIRHPYFQQMLDDDDRRTGTRPVERQDEVCTYLMSGAAIPSHL